MNILNRIGYYLGGFAIGLIIVLFVFNGKRTQCHYGPQARVIDNISQKEWVIIDSTSVLFPIDSLKKRQLLKGAKIDFSASDTSLDSCKIYSIKTSFNNSKQSILVKNCKNQVIVIDTK